MNNSINNVADVFKALGDSTRLKIIKLLIATGNNLCVGMLAQKLGISQPAVSQQLKVLKHAGLVEARRQGFHMHYQVLNQALHDFGIDLEELLAKVKMDTPEVEECEYQGNTEKCNEVN